MERCRTAPEVYGFEVVLKRLSGSMFSQVLLKSLPQKDDPVQNFP
jgi:hypothetical protein